VHHRTIQINHQPDATIFRFIILTFVYSSTYFGRFPAHYQELNDCSGSLWFYLRIVVIAVLCLWSSFWMFLAYLLLHAMQHLPVVMLSTVWPGGTSSWWTHSSQSKNKSPPCLWYSTWLPRLLCWEDHFFWFTCRNAVNPCFVFFGFITFFPEFEAKRNKNTDAESANWEAMQRGMAAKLG